MIMATRQDLLDFWRRLPADAFVHPEDAEALSSHAHDLQTNHLPGPWWGALRTARAFLLFLNPGYNPATDLESAKDPVMASLRRRRLAGEDVERDVLAHHRGRRSAFEAWLDRKLRGVGTADAIEKDICVLNLVAYKSTTFRDHKLIKLLPSSSLIRRVVSDELAPRARAGELMLVVVRQARKWGFSVEDQSATLRVLDPKSEARGGHLTENTVHGQFLRSFLARPGGAKT
jgi:hypothetical protein